MRFALILLVAFACSAVFAQSSSQVRQAEDSDLIVKEWHSPITFEIDAAWLGTLPLGKSKEIDDLPSFHCDNASLESMKVTKTKPQSGIVRLTIEYVLSVQASTHDKLVELEFSLLSDDMRLPLGRASDLKIGEGRKLSSLARYDKPDERFAPYMADGSNPQFRVSMIVRND